MKFQILNKNLWPIAKQVIKHFKQRKFTKILIEKPLKNEYQFNPTIICKKREETIIVEVKEKPIFQDYFENFIKDCLIQRENIKIYMAFPYMAEDCEITYTHSFLSKAKEFGIGILVVKDNKIMEEKKAVKCNMRITITELGSILNSKKKIHEIVHKFNQGDDIDAIRDITELVENAVDTLAVKAAKERKVIPKLKEVTNLNFESKINLLSAPQYKGKRQNRYFSEDLKDDLKSFKRARILSHHPRNRKEEKKLEKQSLERMRMGIRLVQEIYKIKA